MLIIYVAAVGEELGFRLLLLSLLAGLIRRLFRPSGWVADQGIAWTAIGISALLFGAVHLKAWSGTAAVSPGLVLVILSLNTLGGVIFGYVFVKHGIAAAKLAHAGADFAILLIGPLT
jgi:membrane protease YdiL (CAAX protease family)